MAALGSAALGTRALAGTFVRVPPVPTFTAPGSTVTASPVPVSWTYFSAASRAQVSYRLQLLSEDGTTVLQDSGTILSSGTSASLTFALSSGSTYRLQLTLSDGLDAGTVTTTFRADTGAGIFPIETRVGSVYEVAVNGVGYMLADHPDKEIRYERRVVPLDSPRLSTSETPFSQAIDRYTLASGIDWSGGSGQLSFDREGSSAKMYRKSDGINPFSPGTIQTVPGSSVRHSTSFVNARAVVAGLKLFVLTGDGAWTAYDDPTSVSGTSFTITGAGAFKSVCSDGTNWYYADAANVYRNSTAADPVTAWSTSDAHVVQWCSDRIFIARPSSGSTPNALYEMSAAGAEVGGSRVWTLPVGTTITSITSGDGWVWFTGNRSDVSTVFACQLGSDNSYITALEMPTGQRATSIGHYQSNLFVRAVDGAGRAIIYRCAAQDGKLTPTRLLEIPAVGGVDHTVGDFAGDDRFVYFSWQRVGQVLLDPSKTGSGIGCIDLSTGGWAKWTNYRQATTEGTGTVGSIVVWSGRPTFTVGGLGAVMSGTTAVDTGALETSLIDLGTGLRKVWTELLATFDPLPIGGSITLSYSTDGGVSFVALSTVTGPGVKTGRWTLNLESDSIAFRIRLDGTGISPVFRTITVRANPISLADQILVLPVRCADRVTGLNKRELAGSGVGTGANRARALESLVQSRVQVQDIDWPVTRTAQTYDLIAAETRSVGVYDSAQNRQTQSMVTVLTLRRSFK